MGTVCFLIIFQLGQSTQDYIIYYRLKGAVKIKQQIHFSKVNDVYHKYFAGTKLFNKH